MPKIKPGRPRVFLEESMKGYNVRLTVSHVLSAKRRGEGNLSEGIRKALEEADKAMEGLPGLPPLKTTKDD